MRDLIRTVVLSHAHLPTPADALESSTDLYAAGMTSHASVTLMLALEEALDVEFPDAMLTREVFSSIDAIAAAVHQLRPAATA